MLEEQLLLRNLSSLKFMHKVASIYLSQKQKFPEHFIKEVLQDAEASLLNIFGAQNRFEHRLIRKCINQIRNGNERLLLDQIERKMKDYQSISSEKQAARRKKLPLRKKRIIKRRYKPKRCPFSPKRSSKAFEGNSTEQQLILCSNSLQQKIVPL